MMRTSLLALGASFTLSLFAPADVDACRCMPRPSVKDALKKADWVFQGKVLWVKGTTDGRKNARFEVSQYWKGDLTRQVSVFTNSHSVACGYNFQAKKEYVVYATKDKKDKGSTSTCTRTTTLDNAREDLKALGKGKKPGGKPDGGTECKADADCVPAQCCHPASCTTVAKKPNCSRVMCTMDCRGGTMDCGQGSCKCEDGKCAAVMKTATE